MKWRRGSAPSSSWRSRTVGPSLRYATAKVNKVARSGGSGGGQGGARSGAPRPAPTTTRGARPRPRAAPPRATTSRRSDPAPVPAARPPGGGRAAAGCHSGLPRSPAARRAHRGRLEPGAPPGRPLRPGRWSPRPGLARPTAIYAAGANDNGEGARTRETVTPLADKLGIPVDTSFGKGDEKALVEHVIAQPGPTLISWQHGGIPTIADGLPLGDADPTFGVAGRQVRRGLDLHQDRRRLALRPASPSSCCPRTKPASSRTDRRPLPGGPGAGHSPAQRKRRRSRHDCLSSSSTRVQARNPRAQSSER